jgi:hypothetical protein
MAKKPSYKSIERQLLQAIQRNRTGEGGLFDIATMCLTLFSESPDYAAEIGIPDEYVVDHINHKFLRDYAVDLEGILILLKHFPERDQWNRPLLDLLQEAKKAIAAERKAASDEDDKPARRTATVKQLQELQGEVDDKDAIIAKLQGEVDQLQAENRDLRIANAKLEGRIQELERLLKCEGSLS